MLRGSWDGDGLTAGRRDLHHERGDFSVVGGDGDRFGHGEGFALEIHAHFHHAAFAGCEAELGGVGARAADARAAHVGDFHG